MKPVRRDGIDWVHALCVELQIPVLRFLGSTKPICPTWLRRRHAPTDMKKLIHYRLTGEENCWRS